MQNTTLFIIPGACSFGSMVALECIARPYKVAITTPEIRKSEEFLKINPLGKVGALSDGDNLVYENLAILLYLIDKNPESKIALPLNSKRRIDTYKWLSYLSSTLHVAFMPLFNPGSFANEDNQPMIKEYAIQKLKIIFTYLERHLVRHKYFLGEDISIVDAQAYGLLRWGNKFNILEEFQHIQEFLFKMEEQGEVKNALNIEQKKPQELINSSFAGYYEFT